MYNLLKIADLGIENVEGWKLKMMHMNLKTLVYQLVNELNQHLRR